MFWNSDIFKNWKSSKIKNIRFDDLFEFDKNDIDLSDSIDFIPDLSGSEKFFLGRFTCENLHTLIDKIGLTSQLKQMGFENLIIDIDVDQNCINYMKLYWDERIPSRQLLDLRLSETSFIPDKKFFETDVQVTPYSMVAIEWLSAKNPLRKFDSKKPQLPGQTCPGLGVLEYIFDMLHLMTKLVFKDGFMDIPDHMYGAIMYSKKYKFFDPTHEGIIRAVERDMKKHSLSDISWGVLTGTIIDLSTGKPAVYDPSEQIYSVSVRMKRYFESEKYNSTFRKYYEKKKYFLDYNEMLKRRELILQFKNVEDL